MKYTTEERLEIGRKIYEGTINKYKAAEEYGINPTTARGYMREYRNVHGLPPSHRGGSGKPVKDISPKEISDIAYSMEDYQKKTKEELIELLVQARITEARLKKGYEKKGDGSVILYSSKNMK